MKHGKQQKVIAKMGAISRTKDIGTESDLNQTFRMVWDGIADHCSCGFRFHGINYSSSEACEMERYYRKAKEILACNNVFFEKVAQALLKKDLLTMADLKELKKGCALVSVAI